MKVHILGGFLGSGKTTAITSAALLLIEQGKKVAVITNDQGKYLVDTSFIDSNNIPSAEVTNGCFCCNFNSLSDQLEKLENVIKPDCIFAESVGSCTDLVATVLNPLQLLKYKLFDNITFSVFVDCRILLDYLIGNPLPFTDAIVYIFSKQIEEADLLIINKIDLLPAAGLLKIQELANQQLGGKLLIFQNTLNKDHIQKWLDTLESLPMRRREALDIDYEIYGKGEADLAWLDEEINIQSDNDSSWDQAISFIETMVNEINNRKISIGHLKFLLKGEGISHKISFTTIVDTLWKNKLPDLKLSNVQMMVNSRIAATPEVAREIVRKGINSISFPGILVTESHEQSFTPGFPNPTHRITREIPCCEECRCIKSINNSQPETCLCDCNTNEESCCRFQ